LTVDNPPPPFAQPSPSPLHNHCNPPLRPTRPDQIEPPPLPLPLLTDPCPWNRRISQ
ncbi:unnamed protein product, partial [Prunus brigantina]